MPKRKLPVDPIEALKVTARWLEIYRNLHKVMDEVEKAEEISRWIDEQLQDNPDKGNK